MACYAPYWVKADYKRFPRAQDTAGKGLEILSPFSESNRDADTRAFVALMRHIRKVDGDKRTVIMVQVENEVGMIPEARDHCDAAKSSLISRCRGSLWITCRNIKIRSYRNSSMYGKLRFQNIRDVDRNFRQRR